LNPESSDKRISLSGKTIIADLITGSITELPFITYSSGGTYISKLTNDFAAFYEYSTRIGRGIRLWDLKKQSQFGTFPYFSRFIPPQVRSSADGKQILVAGGDTSYRMFIPLPGFLDGHFGVINLWGISNSRWLRSLKTSKIATAIDVSPDGRRIAVGFEDGTVDVLNESFTMRQR
jgi:WD40 repeat protein